MKTISAEMQAHLDGEVTTLATCWKIIRSDDVVLGFTDHDVNIPFENVIYQSNTSIDPSTIKSTASASVDNLDIISILDSSGITDADILAKKYDNAEVFIFMVNYDDLTMGDIKLSRGRLGEIEVRDNIYVAEFRSLNQFLQQRIGERFSTKCRADLGDSRCGVALAGSPSFTISSTVSGVTDRANFTSSGLTAADEFYNFGLVTWTSGNNIGYAMEVKVYSLAGSPQIGTIEFVEKMPYDIQIGDTFDIYAGCDKKTSTCINTFDNIINFRGEPFIPGVDEATRFGGQ